MLSAGSTGTPCHRNIRGACRNAALIQLPPHQQMMSCSPASATARGLSCLPIPSITSWRPAPSAQHAHARVRQPRLVRAAPPDTAAMALGTPRAKLAVFVSGGGSNFKAIHAACIDGRISADVVVVVSDVPTCGGVQYAQAHGISTLTFPAPKKGGFPGLSTQELVEALTEKGLDVDYVLLAGFLKLIPSELVRCFKRRMLNIHPGLLPSFGGKGLYGERVHQAVLRSGARFSGPTVHFVDEEYDTGPILAQRVVPVNPLDTPKQLAARVLKEEHQVYPEAVSALVDGRITWREDGVPVLWSPH